MAEIPFTPENRDKIFKIAERLLGSNNLSLDTAIQQEFEDDEITMTDLHPDLLEVLDAQCLECETCGTWSEPGFINDEQVCMDCGE